MNPRLRERIDLALAIGGDLLTLDDLVGLARERKVQVFGDPDERGVIATEVLTFPRRKLLNAFMVAGELPAIVAMEAVVEGFARDEGCSAITCAGRNAWGRVGRARGWRPHSVNFVKLLERTH